MKREAIGLLGTDSFSSIHHVINVDLPGAHWDGNARNRSGLFMFHDLSLKTAKALVPINACGKI